MLLFGIMTVNFYSSLLFFSSLCSFKIVTVISPVTDNAIKFTIVFYSRTQISENKGQQSTGDLPWVSGSIGKDKGSRSLRDHRVEVLASRGMDLLHL